MSLLELKPFHEAIAEVNAKLWPTYKVSITPLPSLPIEKCYEVDISDSHISLGCKTNLTHACISGWCISVACCSNDKLLSDSSSKQSTIHKHVQPYMDMFLGIHETY